MKIHDYFIPFDDFASRVVKAESGLIKIMANEYFKAARNNLKLNGVPALDLLFPWHPSFSNDTFTIRRIKNSSQPDDPNGSWPNYTEYFKDQCATLDGDDELPIFVDNYNFNAFFTEWLMPIMKCSIRKSVLDENPNAVAIISDTGSDSIIFKSIDDMKKAQFTVLKDAIYLVAQNDTVVTTTSFSDKKVLKVRRNNTEPIQYAYYITAPFEDGTLSAVDRVSRNRLIETITRHRDSMLNTGEVPDYRMLQLGFLERR